MPTNFDGEVILEVMGNTSGELTLYYLIVKDYIRTQAGYFTGVYTHNGVYCEDPIGTTMSTWGSVKALYK